MKKFVIPIILICLFIHWPDLALAQDAKPFVPCDGLECNTCHLVEMGNTILTWLIGVLFLVFAVVAAIAGWGLVTSAGNQTALSAAKSKFTNAMIGLVIVLGAWLLVDTLMRSLLSPVGPNGPAPQGHIAGFGPWSQVECVTPPSTQWDPTEIEVYADGSQLSEEGMPTSSGYSPGPGAPAITPTGELVKYEGAKFDSAIVSNVEHMKDSYGLRVSGGHRTPERNRQVGGVANSNHLTGRAADFVGNSSQMREAKAWADANGARESLIHDAGSGTHLHVAW